jgi:hypothetical protein
MTLKDPLLKLREWLTVDEAAQALSPIFERRLTEAEVLRLALDGYLKLSVILPSTLADCWDVPVDAPSEEVLQADAQLPEDTVFSSDSSSAVDYYAMPDNENLTTIEGIWDLPMVPPGSRQIERRYNELCGLPDIRLEGLVGAIVEGPFRQEPGAEPWRVHCRLRAEGAAYSAPASVIPAGSKIVVRTAAIIECMSVVSTLANPVDKASPVDKDVGKRALRTLLIIIAALAKHPESIDISQPAKAAGIIESLTKDLKARVSARRIEDYLNLIPKALTPPSS